MVMDVNTDMDKNTTLSEDNNSNNDENVRRNVATTIALNRGIHIGKSIKEHIRVVQRRLDTFQKGA